MYDKKMLPKKSRSLSRVFSERTLESKAIIASYGYFWGVLLSGWHGHLHWTRYVAIKRVHSAKGVMNECE
jgi:hypothetical protein